MTVREKQQPLTADLSYLGRQISAVRESIQHSLNPLEMGALHHRFLIQTRTKKAGCLRFGVVFSMDTIRIPNAISLKWQNTHLIACSGGWTRLAGIPESLTQKTADRLLKLGATQVSVLEAGVIRCRAKHELCVHLVNIFPTCPLP